MPSRLNLLKKTLSRDSEHDSENDYARNVCLWNAKNNAQICFVFICLSNGDLHSEQARIEVHETNTTGTQNNNDDLFLPMLFSGLAWARENLPLLSKKKKRLMPGVGPGGGHGDLTGALHIGGKSLVLSHLCISLLSFHWFHYHIFRFLKSCRALMSALIYVKDQHRIEPISVGLVWATV